MKTGGFRDGSHTIGQTTPNMALFTQPHHCLVIAAFPPLPSHVNSHKNGFRNAERPFKAHFECYNTIPIEKISLASSSDKSFLPERGLLRASFPLHPDSSFPFPNNHKSHLNVLRKQESTGFYNYSPFQLPETAVPQNEAFSVPLSARAVLDRLQGWRLVGIAGPEGSSFRKFKNLDTHVPLSVPTMSQC